VLTLYDNALSSNALKVRFLLAELGLAYEKREVPFDRPRPEWVTSFHPLGGIPALDDDGFRLGESNAILRYLAARENRDDLYPADPKARAGVDWVLDAWSTAVRPVALPVERYGGIFGEVEEAPLAGALPAAEEVWTAVDRLLAANGTATGTFTIADVCAGPTLFRWKKLPIDHARWPNTNLLADTVLARPAFAAAGPVR
jgi:glutathione S-transferase